jgi:hypothetical protein
MNELRELSPLLSNKERFDVPYRVPVDYFEGLAGIVLQRLDYENDRSRELRQIDSFLAETSTVNPYTTPTGYFEGLAHTIQEGASALDIANQALQNDPPGLFGLRETSTYQIPPGYFENNPERILQAIRKEASAKIIPMASGAKWFRVAVAAALTGIILTLAWNWKSNQAAIPETANVSSPSLPTSITETEMEIFLDMASLSENGQIASSNQSIDWNSDDMREMLADISEDELMQYLDRSNAQNEF